MNAFSAEVTMNESQAINRSLRDVGSDTTYLFMAGHSINSLLSCSKMLLVVKVTLYFSKTFSVN